MVRSNEEIVEKIMFYGETRRNVYKELGLYRIASPINKVY